MASILIIDDDPMIRGILIKFLNHPDHQLMVAETLTDGLELVHTGDLDLVFLDVNLPDGNGLEAIPSIKESHSEPEIIIITGMGSSHGAEMAIEYGAWDYILKPFNENEIKLNMKRALEYRASKKALTSPAINILDRSSIIGSSPNISSRLNMVSQCSKSDANVLITGQTGTGKELFANTIHINSQQKEKRFMVVDCASLPEQLVESVLFGHVKGAYTGADSNTDGLVKKADGGTLFLDEIGELPMAIQKKFLRVLQERSYKPVGATREISSNFRLISATNRNLEEMVEKNQFRSDLLFRLKTIHIELPSLKMCKSDIKDLTLHYIYTLCKHHHFENKGFASEFLTALESYDWPGNTRELINCLEEIILFNSDAPILYPNFLPRHIRLKNIQATMDKKLKNDTKLNNGVSPPKISNSNNCCQIALPSTIWDPIKPLKEMKTLVIGQLEKLYVEKLMQKCKGDLDQAVTLSHMSKSRIYQLLQKYNIPRPS